MKVLPETDRAAVLEYVSDQLDQQPLRPRPVLPDSDDSAPATKRSRLTAIDEFDDDDQSQQDDMSEIQRYKTSAVNLSGCVDLMSWWNENTTLYPGLSVVARNVLCVMATSAASERNFSLAGHVVSARRSRLNSSSVNNILLMNNAMRA